MTFGIKISTCEFGGDANIQAMAIIKLETILSMDELFSRFGKAYYVVMGMMKFHLYSKYAYHVSGTTLGIWSTSVNKIKVIALILYYET